MKLSLLALTSAASAAVITTRDVVFEARNFTASCVPHSAMCFYSLNAFMPGTMDTQGYDCTASGVGGPGTLPEIQGGTCLPSSRTFDVLRNETGMTVIVSVQVSRLSFTRGAHFIPSDQIQVIKGVTPTGDYTAYVGPKDFPLERIW
ncbi:hypothetical protein QBC43DRAFT_143398 [Cladorrhinum sp. PSN259]|nr:hypothetical protein QBC43DRAFT_143398 [Cladorrhinum sp. PSN259]